MKQVAKIAVVAAAMVLVATAAAMAQGFAPGGGVGGGGFIASLIASALTYVIIPAIDICIFYHAITMMMGGHRMVGIFEAGIGILLISQHQNIVSMVPV